MNTTKNSVEGVCMNYRDVSPRVLFIVLRYNVRFSELLKQNKIKTGREYKLVFTV